MELDSSFLSMCPAFFFYFIPITRRVQNLETITYDLINFGLLNITATPETGLCTKMTRKQYNIEHYKKVQTSVCGRANKKHKLFLRHFEGTGFILRPCTKKLF
jgi:hypothetical protein